MVEYLLTWIIPLAHAQLPPSIMPPGSCDFVAGGFDKPGSMFQCIGDYMGQLVFILISLAATISLIMLMINGFRYMIGPAVPGGSSDAAKKGIGAALAGVVLSLLAYIILDTFIYYITTP